MSKSGGTDPGSEGSGGEERAQGKEAKGHGEWLARVKTGEPTTGEGRPAGESMGMSKLGGAAASCAGAAKQRGAGEAQREGATSGPCGKRTRVADQRETRRDRNGTRGELSEPLRIKTKVI